MQHSRRRALPPFLPISLSSIVLFVALAAAMLEAQTTPPAGGSEAPPQYPTEFNLQFHRTPAEEKAILSSIDGLLNFSSEHSGLPVEAAVKGHLIDREAVKQRVEDNLRKSDVAERLERSSLVLQKLGLVPRDFNLRTFILDLEKDNIQKDNSLAGFYDPSTKEFYMLDWVPATQQFPVMAHELTHALQDQYIGLQAWLKTADQPGDEAAERQGCDETGMARRAVVEGQAMVVTMDYLLAPYARRLTDLPAIDESTLQQATRSATRPAFLRAPRYVRESEIFPYTYGLRFVDAVLRKEGKARAFAGMLKNPPRNTRQIMHPAVYLAGESTPAFSLPPLGPILGSDYQLLDTGTLGEFDVRMFAEQFGSEEKAPLISAEWRGGYYCAARRKTAVTAPDSNPGGAATSATDAVTNPRVDGQSGPVALFYISRWSTPAAAVQFAHLYASSVMLRYSGATLRPKPPQAALGRSDWNTPEGAVSVEVHGPDVLVLESFDDKTAARLRNAVRTSVR